MAAKHKFSGSHVTIRSSLSADRLAEVSKAVGEQTKGNLMIGLNQVRFEGASAGRTNFSIRAMGQLWELMTFHVSIADAGTGSTARSAIDSFKTSQSKLLMVIPLGPKTMSAYKTYRLFMENLVAGVKAEDRASRSTIIERVAP
jgi:hypothetical protein